MTSESEPNISVPFSPIQQALPATPSRSTSQISMVSAEALMSHSSPTKQLTASHRSSRPSPLPYNTLLNAPADSPALRTRASTASSSRAPSVLDEAHVEHNDTEIQVLEITPSMDSYDLDEGSDHTSLPSDAPSIKGKEKQRSDDRSEIETVGAGGEMALPSGDARRGLKELVRRSASVDKGYGGRDHRRLSEKLSRADGNLQVLITQSDKVAYSPRLYYVLTNAGKPVFCSHTRPSEDDVTNLMGVAQAIISIFADDGDRLRYIIKGKHRVAFLLKAPLYLFCVSDWGEPEHVLRLQLEYIHLQILSVVSSTQLLRLFQRRSNADLSTLLEGTEPFLRNLIDCSQYDFSFLTSTLQPLRMAPALRDTSAAALMPPSKFKDLLYVLLIAGGHIVTALRPRKHSIHPSDLHLLLNTIASSSALRTTETWLPICFPKFNPSGFVHAYISYVLEDVGLVFVSADREAFEDLRIWKDMVLEKLEQDKTLSRIQEAIPLHPYTISSVGCPGLRHFIYKSRQHVQITQPVWEAPYEDGSTNQKRLVTTYQKLHDAVHAKSGQASALKLVYISTEHEACLVWATKPFELYITVSPQLSKSAVVAAANNVAKWVLGEEGRIFLKDAPVF
ncbi:vacuolar fusion protein MON1 [Cryptococcus neoformans Bt1]|nr:vacuolar fusion protein MON1 [Cryptococcus neoformans var. grubii Bt1]OXG26200.1 vacuolar fusion protein MON1 [Cryptococcus neoformans var. grubii Ze90-1]OXG34014.1 vacuolar fusion protein MON1 [Cryptococcus neoformans var. grubii Bt15]OXG42547.1 vacuolar fusion protein MON1 [Cryptococcus neoformans var. grubii Bt120]